MLIKSRSGGTSLVAQWLRIRLPRQGTRVRALVQEDPTCRRATKPVRHSYWACALQPASHNYWARVPGARAPQRERPLQWGARARRSWRGPTCSSRDPMQPKINFKKRALVVEADRWDPHTSWGTWLLCAICKTGVMIIPTSNRGCYQDLSKRVSCGFFLFCFVFVFVLATWHWHCGMWDLSAPTSNRTVAPCSERAES